MKLTHQNNGEFLFKPAPQYIKYSWILLSFEM